MQLDVKRAARVYGSSRAMYFQDGQYFAGDGTPLSLDEAAQPNPDDVANGAIKLEVTPAEPAPVVTTIPAPPKIEEPVAVIDKPIERVSNTDSTYGNDRLLKLKKLSGHLLATMVMKAGGTPAMGIGSKKKNIAWLLDNVKS